MDLCEFESKLVYRVTDSQSCYTEKPLSQNNNKKLLYLTSYIYTFHYKMCPFVYVLMKSLLSNITLPLQLSLVFIQLAYHLLFTLNLSYLRNSYEPYLLVSCSY